MKILHVWNQAGVASVLAKYQRKEGRIADVIKRDGFDRYGIEKYYGTEIYHGQAFDFYRYAAKKSLEYDIVHVHSLFFLIPFLIKKRKPYVIHFHGSELRNIDLKRKLLLKITKPKMLISTPDLLCLLPNAEWLPTPVDTELFYPRKPRLQKLELPVPHELMPDYLLQQKIYVETTHPWTLPKTAYEALACGIPVKWNGLIITPPLPEQHKPENVAKRTIEIYEEILKR